MKADPKVIADLQTAGGVLASMVEQFRVDIRLMKGGDQKYSAAMISGWYEDAEAHLGKILKRLVCFESDPGYSIASPQGGADPVAIMKRQLTAAQAAFTQFCVFRQNSWNIRADSVCDLFEHAVQFLEKVVFKLEMELRLVGLLTPAGYIGARLEDA